MNLSSQSHIDLAAASVERLIILAANSEVAKDQMFDVIQIANIGVNASMVAALIELGLIQDLDWTADEEFAAAVNGIRQLHKSNKNK